MGSANFFAEPGISIGWRKPFGGILVQKDHPMITADVVDGYDLIRCQRFWFFRQHVKVTFSHGAEVSTKFLKKYSCSVTTEHTNRVWRGSDHWVHTQLPSKRV